MDPLAVWRPQSEYTLTTVAPEVRVVRHPLSFYGFSMHTCMTVVSLPDGGLWLHSPIPLAPGLGSALAGLGPVRYIIAPNRLHHLYALDCARHHPDARLFVAPGLADKNPLLSAYPPIPPATEAPWHDSLDSLFVEGNPELNETVFFHRPSRSLILTDLAVHLGPWDSLGTRLYARANGFYDRFGHSFLLRRFFRDKEAARRSVAKILAWEPEIIIPAHGPVIRHEATEQLRKAFRWLL